jgi:hypothetical protein
MEVVLDLAAAVAQQHVGDAGALRAGQPGGDEGVGGIDLAVHPQRPAAEEDRHHRDAVGLQLADQFQVAGPAGLEHQVGQVALELCIGLFAEDHYCHVGPGAVRAVHRQFGVAAGSFDLLAEAVPDRVGIGEVLAAGAAALPGQRPAAGLLAEVVGAVAGQQDAPARIQRQHAAVVLQQHQRFAHRAPGDRAMFRRAEQFELPAQRALRRLGCSNRPMLNLTRRMRRTASSRRAIGIVPAFTCASVESYSPFQLSGAIAMSSPALKVRAQSVLVQPGTWPWPFQSPTMKPPKFIRVLQHVGEQGLVPCSFSPWKLL